MKIIRSFRVKSNSLLHDIRQKRKIKSGDKVKIITGNAKGKIGNVIRVFYDNRVIVDCWSSVRNISTQKEKTIYKKIHISNLMHYDSVSNVASKLKAVYQNTETSTDTNKEEQVFTKNKKIYIYKKSGNIVPKTYVKNKK
ncbi:hypothetical protein AB837_00154 [bacterium AB1]|nr:hypothetical protein AB837_00154 [bacterium AB1]